MQKTARLGLAGVVVTAAMMMASNAMAQEASGQAGLTLSGTPTAAGVAGDSDHQAMATHLGVGYLGRRSIPIMQGGGDGGPSLGSVEAPVIGVRYWLDPSMGIDAGLGLVVQGGSSSSKVGDTTIDTDQPGVTGFLLHAGVPLNLADAGHFSFQIVPELNVGFASSTIEQGGNTPDLELSGFTLDLGARAGAEIHFGFIGVPQLSLQGSVGLLFRMQSGSATQGSDELSVSNHVLTTTVGDNPWNIFTSNVAAMYYF